ncbi:MAG: aminodeoxychorismate synthase component I [Nibricoccus sp.]
MKPKIRPIDLPCAPDLVFAGVCDRRGAFLLESASDIGGLGKFSFIGFDPFLVVRAADGLVNVCRTDGEEDFRADALDTIKRLLGEHRCDSVPGVPFVGGAVGFCSYEFGAKLENVVSSKADDLRVPDVEFGFYDGIIMFDHVAQRVSLVACPVNKYAPTTIFRRLEKALAPSGSKAVAGKAVGKRSVELTAAVTKEDYLKAISRIKNYIAEGDVYQVNLTQRFDAALAEHPYSLYQKLRKLSAAPFACYLNSAHLQIVSSSPERFLRVSGRRVETRPIKGTRPRGSSSVEDQRLRAELAASEKDQAELLMIVDLQRNDLGRVCVPGSIKVDEMFTIETHPTVHHLVANVSGELRPGCDVVDCLRAALPGGSITGAPKIRAMQIIEELEKTRRGVYTGAIGYLGFDGSCDFNIAIRTILCAHGRAYYHVGGGIVWDSKPEAEFQETLDKGAAMRAALLGQTA